MDTFFKVPLWRIFLNWFIAIIAGSILWPLISMLFKGSPADDLEEAGALMLISAVMSGLTSLPAILLLLLATWRLNLQQLNKSTYRMFHMAIHLFLALLTFAVMYPFAELSDKEAFIYLILAFSYTLSGIVSWAVTFRFYANRSKEIPVSSEELLDGRIS